jgi:DNA polymerase-1
MRHIQFQASERHTLALLVKGSAFKHQEIMSNYVHPLESKGLAQKDMIAFTLDYEQNGKASVKYMKDYLAKLLPSLVSMGVTTLYVTDGAYFKTLTKEGKAEPHFGYVLPCKIEGFENLNVVLGLNYQQLIYNPDLQAKLDLSLNTLVSHLQGSYQALGANIIHSASYPETSQCIAAALRGILAYPSLTCDIEAFSLRFNEAGIGTISFAWDEHNGIAFACDYKEIWGADGFPDRACPIDIAAYYGYFKQNTEIRGLLKEFFTHYQGKMIWHNAAYDVKVLIYTLWMKDALDTEGLLQGLEIMSRHIDDTKVIAYLATNSTAGNVLGLKALAHEFAGNWAVEEINDIRKIPLKELLQYNLVDALSTRYVHNKYYPIMVQDKQEDLYFSLMLPSLKLIIQIELTGMPMNQERIQHAKKNLETLANGYLDTLTNSPVIKMFNLILQKSEWEKDFEGRKAKAKNPGKILPKHTDAFADKAFNPNSGPQTQRLLYELMGLPVIDLTDTKQPATGGDTLEKLLNHTQEPAYKEIIQALIGFSGVDKILTSFIPNFEKALDKGDGCVWLHGSFNLGGTVSGRLSSSKPNLQQIPANSEFGKLIKECFNAPNGWLFCGADFNSLEDYISALTTKDPNKLAVYEKGFDGHCLRAAYYFRDQLPNIDVTDPKSVNSIKKAAPELRQESKTPTFALTYQGTYHTLMANLGWEEAKAKAIETAYHELYKVSDEYVQSRLMQASKDGYVEVAFGLRVRTPLLKQVIFNGARMPYEAAAEGRTAGNALGQSYGLLNNRAAVEFMQKVWDSPYRYDILPVALIHDAIYLLIRDRVDVMEWANRELIKSMRWQELPEIQHPTVKLGAALDIFWPDWAHPITLPNDADQETIRQVCREAKEDMLKKAA